MSKSKARSTVVVEATNQVAPFSQLRLSPLNVRQVSPTAVAELEASIEANGLLQNLVVYEEDDLFYVVAGGRRFTAMQNLKKRKAIPAAYPVPVRVVSKAEAVEVSLQENEQREDMHPADTVRAYAALHGAGMSAKDIAVRFGKSEGHVSKLLKLGGLAPSLLTVWADDGMSIEAAQALCLTDDHAKQEEVFSRHGNYAYGIRRALTDEKMRTDNAVFRFVGMEAYVAAGGTITADLFSTDGDGYADNGELVDELAAAKLAEVADTLRSEGWFKVETAFKRPDSVFNLSRLFPEKRPYTDEEQAELEQIDARLEEMEAAGEYDEEQADSLMVRRDEIEQGASAWTEEQKEIGGVVAYIDFRGDLELFHYRAKKAEAAKGENGDNAKNADAGLYSAALIEDLSKIKTQALQAAVAADPALALDILLDGLVGQQLHNLADYYSPLSLRVDRPSVEVGEELLTRSSITRVEETLANEFSIPRGNRFEAIRQMESADKMRLLAGLVGMMIDGTLPKGFNKNQRHTTFEQYANAANLDMAQVWQAPVGFFDRMKRSDLLTLLSDESGADAASNCAKLKKGELVKAVSERLPCNWLPAYLQTQVMQQTDTATETPDVSEQIDEDVPLQNAA